MTEMFGEAWSPMSVPDLAPDDDDERILNPTVRGDSNHRRVFPAGAQNYVLLKDNY